MDICKCRCNMNEFLCLLCSLGCVCKVYQPVIREAVVEHDRTCICQSGYILDRPCDNFQDIYSDMYSCSLEIKEHEPEKVATEMVQRGGRQTCISGYVCDCHPCVI